MIIINTGNGKGKTTQAVGQVIRALGHGMPVAIIQLFKGKEFYGEQNILLKLKGLDFFGFAPKHPYCFPEIKKHAAVKQCRDAVNCLKALIDSKEQYKLIVLDEFNVALRDGYLRLEPLLELLKSARPGVDILITGRGAPEKLIKAADLVTEMVEIKHPYRKGVSAKKGIEF